MESKLTHPPILERIHVLPLSEAAVSSLFPRLSKSHSKRGVISVFDIPKQSESSPIINHLSRLLQLPHNSYVLSLYQHFYVCRNHYVVVDMETSGNTKVSRGLLTVETWIYTEGEPLEPLKTLQLSLLRPFSRTENCGSPSSSLSKPLTSVPSKHFSFRNAFGGKANSSKEQQNVENLQTSISDHTHPTIAVNLIAVLQKILNSNPCIVFIRGRELATSCPEEIPFLVPDPWDADRGSQQNHQRFNTSPSINDMNSSTMGSNLRSVDPSSSSAAIDGASNFSVTQTSSSLLLCQSRQRVLRFFVASTGRQALGIIAPLFTHVRIQLDPCGEFSRVQISPISDTIPRSYRFSFFEEYLRPFLEASTFRLFYRNQTLDYHGIQFKIQRTLPGCQSELDIPDKNSIYWIPFNGLYNTSYANNNVSIMKHIDNNLKKKWEYQRDTFLKTLLFRRDASLCARIGQQTRIHQGSPVRLHWLDLLPSDIIDRIARLPTRLQPFALINAIGDLSPYDLMRVLEWGEEEHELEDESYNRAKENLAASIVEEFSTIYSHQQADLCIVCLENVEIGARVLVLPCSHTFHVGCVLTWIKRSASCPVCKRSISDFLT